MQSNGNFELLRALKTRTNIKAGENIKVSNDGIISTVFIPNFGDVQIDGDKLITELLDEKINKVNDVNLTDNAITLNLGSINGLQVPTDEHQAANKKYVDDVLTYFWEQLQTFNYINFKGVYNADLTYKMGDFVINVVDNDIEFYLSVKDLNNEPLTNINYWVPVGKPLNGNLVTTDQLKKVQDELMNAITALDNQTMAHLNNLLKRIRNLEIANETLTAEINNLKNNAHFWLRAKYDGASIYFYLTDDNNNNAFGDISITYNFQNGYMDNGNSFNTVNNRTITATNKSMIYLSSYPARNDYYAAYEYIIINAEVTINNIKYYASWNNFWITHNGRAQFPNKSVTFNIPLMRNPY